MPSYQGRKCRFCIDQVNYVDYKNMRMLRRFMSQFIKIVPRYYSGNCVKHQKKVGNAIKRARIMALLPFVK